MLPRFRYRLASRLVGPFVSIPARNGVWVVIREVVDGYDAVVTYEADRFRLKSSINLKPKWYGSTDPASFGAAPSCKRFVGTVKP